MSVIKQAMGSATARVSGIIQAGFWTPGKLWTTAAFMHPLKAAIQEKHQGTPPPLAPAVAEFKRWLEGNSVTYKGEFQKYSAVLKLMIDQTNSYVNTTATEKDCHDLIEDDDFFLVDELIGDPTLGIQAPSPLNTIISDYDFFFLVLSEIIATAPTFNDSVMVGTPMNGFLAVSMAQPAGVFLFLDPGFNAQLKLVLNAWNSFLKSKESMALVLNKEFSDLPISWMSDGAVAAGVWDNMKHDPGDKHYGFRSWNDFFTRTFVDGYIQWPAPPNADKDPSDVVCIGCMTTPWVYESSVDYRSDFAIKEFNYSLLDIFGQDADWAEKFTGGQLYQGFLSATHYHRWNSPVRGKVVAAWVEEGTYFAQYPFFTEGPETWEGTDSQPYLPQVATRAIFVFETKKFGYVAMILVGMVEVSTCFIDEKFRVGKDGSPVDVALGEEIGNFEFGGSTHVLIFEKDKAKLMDWALNASPSNEAAAPIKLGTVIAELP